MIDKNQGEDFPTETLKAWKFEHDTWVKSNLNKSINALIPTISGEHSAQGKGKVVGLDIQGPAFIKPGTKVTAEGEGDVTGTRVGYREKKN